MRAFGKGCEEMQTETSRRNILFLMYDQEEALPVIEENPKSDECHGIG
jgi:hypothetical protein